MVLQISCSNASLEIQNDLAESFPDLKFAIPERELLRVEANEPIRVGPLIRFLENKGIEVAEARKRRPSLEDIFVKVTGIETTAMRKEKEKPEVANETRIAFWKFWTRICGPIT
jgi:ABC-2 type transport system ATP-binding protein